MGTSSTWTTARTSGTNTYDYENRLIKVLKNDVLLNRYFYDADGRRVKIVDGQGVSIYNVYSGLDIIYEKTVSSTTKHYYVNGLHIAENRDDTIEYYHQDHLGSTRLKTNINGQTIFDRNYEPFGPDYGGSGSEEFKYTGKHMDASGLYYFGTRYYDPDVGRFITEDPVLGNIGNPQDLNRFTYCRNNPYKYTDPDGNEPIIITVCSYYMYVIFGMLVISTCYIVNEIRILRRNPTPEGLIASYKERYILGTTVFSIPKLAPFIAINTSITIEQSKQLISTNGSGISYIFTRSQDRSFDYGELIGTMLTSYGISYSINYYISEIP